MSWRVDQVDQELITSDLLWDVFEIFLIWQMSVQGDGCRLDGNAAILLVLTCICEATIILSVYVYLRGLFDAYASPAFAAEIIPAR